MRTLAITLAQKNAPLVGANVTLKDGAVTAGGVTNKDGFYASTLNSVPYFELIVDAPGFQHYDATVTLTHPMPPTITIDAPAGPLGNVTVHFVDALTPIALPAPHLEIRGNDFVDAQGHPACYSCVDLFPAFRMFRDGRLAELEALAAESHEFGFAWWRVFMMGSIAQNTIFSLSPSEPGYYDDVRPFADWLNAHGIGLLAEIFVDNQDVKAPPDHWARMANLLRGSTTILSGGNEWNKNGFDPQALTDPGMVWSRGSSLADQLTPQNGASCCSFHQRTDSPATRMDSVASAVYMRQHGYTVPMMDEPTRFDENGNKSGEPDSVRFAFDLARVYGAYWSLACFHHWYGQRGLLMSPAVRVVAASWQRGLAR